MAFLKSIQASQRIMDSCVSTLIQQPRSEEFLLLGLESFIGKKEILLNNLAIGILVGSLTSSDISQLFSLSVKYLESPSKFKSLINLFSLKPFIEFFLQDLLFLKRGAQEALVQNYCSFLTVLLSMHCQVDCKKFQNDQVVACTHWCHFYLSEGGKFSGELAPFRMWLTSFPCVKILLFFFIKEPEFRAVPELSSPYTGCESTISFTADYVLLLIEEMILRYPSLRMEIFDRFICPRFLKTAKPHLLLDSFLFLYATSAFSSKIIHFLGIHAKSRLEPSVLASWQQYFEEATLAPIDKELAQALSAFLSS